MKTKPLGFIVVLDRYHHGIPLALFRGKRYGHGGALLIGRHATLFETKRQAERAIDSTMAYALANNISSWSKGEFSIKAIRSVPQ